jgi:hypothetical protein
MFFCGKIWLTFSIQILRLLAEQDHLETNRRYEGEKPRIGPTTTRDIPLLSELRKIEHKGTS